MTVKWNDAEVRRRVTRAALRGVFRGGHLVRTHAVNAILSGPKSGRVYMRRSVAHQASAPGEAPASDTGNLARSIDVVLDEGRITAVVRARAAYAAYLEYGTQTMAPRPFMRPALAANRAAIEAIIAAELRRELPR